MARPTKETVDYFPHYCISGKTLFIIENQFGNDGYCFWFKLLELLGRSPKHFYDCNNPSAVEFMSALTRLMPTLCIQILDKLALLQAIDSELWEKRIIFSENFVSGIEDAYNRRNVNVVHKRDLCMHLFGSSGVNVDINGVNVDINPQIRLKESKVNEIKEKEKKEKDFKNSFDVNENEKYGFKEFVWETEKNLFLTDQIWKESFCMKKSITMGILENCMKKFVSDIELSDDKKHNKDLKNHFLNKFNKVGVSGLNKTNGFDHTKVKQRKQAVDD